MSKLKVLLGNLSIKLKVFLSSSNVGCFVIDYLRLIYFLFLYFEGSGKSDSGKSSFNKNAEGLSKPPEFSSSVARIGNSEL